MLSAVHAAQAAQAAHVHGNAPVHGGEGGAVVSHDEVSVLRVFALHRCHCVWTRLSWIGSIGMYGGTDELAQGGPDQERVMQGRCGERCDGSAVQRWGIIWGREIRECGMDVLYVAVTCRDVLRCLHTNTGVSRTTHERHWLSVVDNTAHHFTDCDTPATGSPALKVGARAHGMCWPDEVIHDVEQLSRTQ